MVPVWVTVLVGLGAGVVGTILTSISQFWINKQLFNQRLEQERFAYKREQREKKIERIRQAGANLLQGVQEAQFALAELYSLSENVATELWGREWALEHISEQLRSSRVKIGANSAILNIEVPEGYRDYGSLQAVILRSIKIADLITKLEFPSVLDEEGIETIERVRSEFEEQYSEITKIIQEYTHLISNVISSYLRSHEFKQFDAN